MNLIQKKRNKIIQSESHSLKQYINKKKVQTIAKTYHCHNNWTGSQIHNFEDVGVMTPDEYKIQLRFSRVLISQKNQLQFGF